MSRLPFELLLALRYLRPKRTFVSFITLISIVGVMLGVAVLIIVIAVMSGFDKEWQERILGFNSHMKIVNSDRSPMDDYEAVSQRVAANPLVKGVSPFSIDQVFVETQPEFGESQVSAPVIRGIVPESEGQVSVLPESIIEGEFDVFDSGLLIGKEFAWNMNLDVGDRLAVYSRKDLRAMRKRQNQTNEVAVLPDDFEVRGIFDVHFSDYNSMVIFTSLEDAQIMNGWDDAAQGLLVKLDDPFSVYKVEETLRAELGDGFRYIGWNEEYSEIFGALVMEKNMIRFLLFFIVLVAAFGITSSLITFVVQKTREIGMLRALGASSNQIMALFLGQCLVIGIIGVSTGLAMGLAALRWRNDFLNTLNKLTGNDLMPSAIYQISELPVLVMRSDLIVICGVSILICLVAGLIPAWIASRLAPVEALRHD